MGCTKESCGENTCGAFGPPITMRAFTKCAPLHTNVNGASTFGRIYRTLLDEKKKGSNLFNRYVARGHIARFRPRYWRRGDSTCITAANSNASRSRHANLQILSRGDPVYPLRGDGTAPPILSRKEMAKRLLIACCVSGFVPPSLLSPRQGFRSGAEPSTQTLSAIRE